MTDDHTKLAVYNNAVWCDTVCRAHGWPGEFHAQIWINSHTSLPYYPNAVTLTTTHAAPRNWNRSVNWMALGWRKVGASRIALPCSI